MGNAKVPLCDSLPDGMAVWRSTCEWLATVLGNHKKEIKYRQQNHVAAGSVAKPSKRGLSGRIQSCFLGLGCWQSAWHWRTGEPKSRSSSTFLTSHEHNTGARRSATVFAILLASPHAVLRGCCAAHSCMCQTHGMRVCRMQLWGSLSRTWGDGQRSYGGCCPSLALLL